LLLGMEMEEDEDASFFSFDSSFNLILLSFSSSVSSVLSYFVSSVCCSCLSFMWNKSRNYFWLLFWLLSAIDFWLLFCFIQCFLGFGFMRNWNKGFLKLWKNPNEMKWASVCYI
jgi:hypothetical protein